MVKGTGPDARITAKDVEVFAVSGPPPPAAAPAAPAVAAPAAAPPGMPAAAFEDIPLTNVRQVNDMHMSHLPTLLTVTPVLITILCASLTPLVPAVRWVQYHTGLTHHV